MPRRIYPELDYTMVQDENFHKIPKYMFLVDGMPFRGSPSDIVHIWLDIWFWACRINMDIRITNLRRITWDAAHVYALPRKELQRDLLAWGFDKKICRNLSRDIVKARKEYMANHRRDRTLWVKVREFFGCPEICAPYAPYAIYAPYMA